MLCCGDGTLTNAGEHVRTENWRKRVGVEPSKDRLAALPGFEVRTPHQGRFPSPFESRQIKRIADEIHQRCRYGRTQGTSLMVSCHLSFRNDCRNRSSEITGCHV